MIDLFVEVQTPLNQVELGKIHLLLIEGRAKRDANVLLGKTDHYKSGYVKVTSIPVYEGGKEVGKRELKIGDYVVARVDSVGPRALYCEPLAIASTLPEYHTNINIF